MKTLSTLSRRELVALLVSGGVVLFMICYWIAQIAGVIEMLHLAYG